MGHERVGALPHSKQWRDVIAQLAASSGSDYDVADIARSTLDNVRNQFRRIHRDQGVVAAFQFLVALSIATSATSPVSAPGYPDPADLGLTSNPSTLRLVAELRSWVDAHRQSTEYAEISKKAAADAIALWSERQQQQPALFSDRGDSAEIWRRANTGDGFCEVARLFFSKFTERYLNYFLGREASAELGNAGERDQFAYLLRGHIDDVSKFAFETSRITQSFAAGWFNSHARDRAPSVDELEGFLGVAFGKLREELMREASPA